MIRALLSVLLISSIANAQQTVAEKSDFKATSRHADVVGFCEALAKNLPNARLADIGKSREGRTLPLLILSDPPIATPEEAERIARRDQKAVVLAFANIHAGEVDGKEALLMLARDIATDPKKTLLKKLIVLIVPILNADGNERIDINNRKAQNGPPDGVEDEVPAYPVQNRLTQPMRTAAEQAGDPELMSLWAGQAVKLAQPGAAGEMVRRWWAEAKDAAAELSARTGRGT